MKEIDQKKGLVDGLEVLSNISGLSKLEMREIWDNVKANRKQLDACVRPHLFVPAEADPKSPWNQRYVCTKCKGIVPKHDALLYKEGLDDARKR